MRHGTASRRQRNRSNGGRRNNQQRTQVFDSNGPDVRIRGTAHQVAEKYAVLAKDAAAAGDTILTQSYLQHAEHYQRIINDWEGSLYEYERTGFITEPDYGQAAVRGDSSAPGGVRGSEDDLSLPSSVLGGDSKAEPKKETMQQRMEREIEKMAG